MEKQDLILKKDARILWNVNKKGEVVDLIVVEFTKDNDPQYLYNKYKFDVGNCVSDWNTFNNAYIMYYIFISYDFCSTISKIRAFEQLLKIKEFNEEFSKSRNGNALNLFNDLISSLN